MPLSDRMATTNAKYRIRDVYNAISNLTMEDLERFKPFMDDESEALQYIFAIKHMAAEALLTFEIEE